MFQLLKDNWDKVLYRLKEDQELSDISFDTWVKPLEPVIFNDETNVLLVSFPGEKFGLEYIQNKKYDFFLKVHIKEITGISCTVEFTQKNNQPQKTPAPAASEELVSKGESLNKKYTFDSFVVGSNNRMAHAACLAVAESPAEAFNPLFIYGGVGLGKTHLMHSIGNFILRNNSSARVMYVTSEVFTNELIDAIRNKNNATTTEFRQKYRSNDILMVDDVQFIIGKDSTQEEFFHTFNALYQAKKQIILSSDRPPNEMELLEERLKSRFSGGLTVSISEPDYETRMAILRKKEESEGVTIDNDVIKYIATHVKSNIRELEGALTKIIACSRLENRQITLEKAEDLLKDQVSSNKTREITPDLIIQTVSEHSGISIDDLVSSKRSKDIAYPRQIAMYLCKTMTSVPYQEIGKLLGDRDHSTVMHGHDKIKKDLETNESLRSTIEILKKKINPVL